MILIVDDQKDLGAALAELLCCAGHEAAWVVGGAEALAILHVRKPSLLILDVDMPEMDGLTVLRTIKADATLRDIRVLMHSANPHHETMIEAKRLGALDFVTKGKVALHIFAARIVELMDGKIPNTSNENHPRPVHEKTNESENLFPFNR